MSLRGRIKYVISKRSSKVLSRVHRRGLRSSALPSLALVFTGVTQITLFSSDTKSGIIVLTVYVDDFLLADSDSAGLRDQGVS